MNRSLEDWKQRWRSFSSVYLCSQPESALPKPFLCALSGSQYLQWELLQLPIASCLHSPHTNPHPSTNTRSLTRFSSTLGNASLPRLSPRNPSDDLVSEAKAEKAALLRLFCVLCLVHQWVHVFLSLPFTGDEPFLWHFTSLTVSMQMERLLSRLSPCVPSHHPVPLLFLSG